MTIATTAPTLSAAGISAPAFSDVLDYFKAQYRLIYGSDIYLENDSQDGQFLAIVARAVSDSNAAAIAVYNQFSPVTAAGNGLSSNVKLNGIRRKTPTNSTADITVVGVAGTAIINGVVQDAAKNNWTLPASVNIPAGGQITVTATCAKSGAVAAAPNTIKTIITPQLGWQSATNAAAAVLGAPVESDAALRQRQALSVAQPAQTSLVTTIGAVAAVPGVTRCTGTENPTNAVDANGLPPHSLAIVAEGGDLDVIAAAIANKKTTGAATYGTTSRAILDAYGLPRTINFFQVSAQRISIALSIHPISGYTAAIGAKIQATVAAYVNALAIGQTVIATRLFGPANLAGDPDGSTYSIYLLGVAVYPGTPALVDVPMAFNAAAHCDPSDVVITLV